MFINATLLPEHEFLLPGDDMRFEAFSSEKLKILRGEKGLSQDDLAQLCEVHLQTIKTLEAGKSKPTLPILGKLGKAFGLYFYADHPGDLQEQEP
jgi:putative transcriptional regulator